jgi:hypothetical protein
MNTYNVIKSINGVVEQVEAASFEVSKDGSFVVFRDEEGNLIHAFIGTHVFGVVKQQS